MRERTLRDLLIELARSQDSLRSSEEQLRDFLENANLGTHRVGPDGTILWANEFITDALPVLVSYIDSDERYRFVSAGYERWFGHAKSKFLGKSVAEVLGAEAYAAVRSHIRRALSGESVSFEAELPYRDGGTRYVEASYIPRALPDGSIAGFIGLISDIGDRKAFERFRAAAADRAERLLKVTSAIANAVTADEVFSAVVDQVAEAVDASSAGLWLIDSATANARLVRSRGYSESATRNLADLPLDLTPSIPALDAIQTRQPVWITSQAQLFERYPHLRSVATAGRRYRVSCLPLITQERVLGLLALTIEEDLSAADGERDFLLLISRYASQAIERLSLFEAERRSRADADAAARRLRALGQASRAFAESDLDLQSRLRAVASELASALGGCINIALLESDGLLHLGAVHHPFADAQDILQRLARRAPLALGEGMTGSLAATGESMLLPSIDREQLAARAAPEYREFLGRFPVFALIGVPLRAQGRVIGAVTSARCREGETYTPEDLAMLEELAARAAVAIENSRLYQETRDARSRAEQLYRFAQAAVTADNIDTVYDAALTAIEAAVGAHRSAVLTFDTHRVMQFRAWRNLSDVYREAVAGHSPWSPDAISPEPVLVPDPQADPAMASYMPLFRQEGIGALAFIPLVTGGRLLGKFMIYFDQRHDFTLHEVDGARAIANHLASVITRFAAVAKLEDTIRSNELFAGVLAHDLRNPLAAMMTGAQMLLVQREGESATRDAEKKPLGRILASGQRMQTMIHQLLDFTRARAGGGIAVEPHETNLADLCAQAVAEFELSHPAWHIRREVVGDQRGSWDSDRLLQVLSNLVANAGQHGTPGAEISVTLDGSQRERVRIEIHNQGMIPTLLQPHLFDPFRSTRHRHDHSRGLGLGLFIVREIVRAHGGTIDVSSSETAGTRFMVALPRQSAGGRGSPSM
ncbi:MAG TPA: GAF domain-containing protein [Polyangiales bacterium]|nr:GAF domain-containing protein [Polyangiales bacterium]